MACPLRPCEAKALRVLASTARPLTVDGWRALGLVGDRNLSVLASLGLAELLPGWPRRYRITPEGLAWLREEQR